MTIFDLIRQAGAANALGALEQELSQALHLYRESAVDLLQGSGINLTDNRETFFKLENNFFSALFLYSYHRAGLPRQRRILYAALNHCLRGMVTGCDNILDNEYKQTLATDLPAGATRFRSIIDIMASDRILFHLLMAAAQRQELTADQVVRASTASLHALTASGIQESGEELGISRILPPDEIIARVHHYKTGLLFNCPWGIPEALEQLDSTLLPPIKKALYDIGIGCQIMDDMVDLGRDTRESRHNYVASLIYHGPENKWWEQLQHQAAAEPADMDKAALLFDFPAALHQSVHAARQHLVQGLTALFDPAHAFAVEPALAFLYRRIGTEHFMQRA